jgi:hypothetical protein
VTLPPYCALCGNRVSFWDEDEPGRCIYCGADVPTYESLTPKMRRRIMRTLAIDTAHDVDVKGGVL